MRALADESDSNDGFDSDDYIQLSKLATTTKIKWSKNNQLVSSELPDFTTRFYKEYERSTPYKLFQLFFYWRAGGSFQQKLNEKKKLKIGLKWTFFLELIY